MPQTLHSNPISSSDPASQVVERVKIGIVGLNWGQHVIENEILRGRGSSFFELAGVCSQEKEQTRDAANRYGVPGYNDLSALLNDPEIAAVGLMTGPTHRAQLIRQIIEAGKDVMTTKPFELDSNEGLAVLHRARELGRIVHLNSPSPTPSPDVAQIMAWQKELELGRPVAARADIWANYRETNEDSWYDDLNLCPVAPIFRLGIYLINDLLRLFGAVESVGVVSSHIFTGRPTPDNAQLCLKFKNGALANVFASFCINDAQWWLSSLTLNYENGTIYRNAGPVERPDQREHPLLHVVTSQDGKAVTRSMTAAGSTEDYQWETFHRAIRGEALPGQLTPEETIASVRVIQAMSRAEKTGQRESIEA